jgi:hypothetical protein
MSTNPRTPHIELPPDSTRLSERDYRRKFQEELSPQEQEEFLARLRDILAGKLPAEPLQIPPVIRALVDRELAGMRVTAEARQRIYLDSTLDYYYGGSCVAYLEKDGQRIILAVGPGEVSAMLQGLPTPQRSKVLVVHPIPC